LIWQEAAPAKLNLALHVRHRRADGYHELDTIFAFTHFGDTLTAVAAPALSLTVAGPFGAAIEIRDNLVLRAAAALQTEARYIAGAALSLDKRIPVAAGLGGGSADAAAALRLLNRMWSLHWPAARLAGLAAELGADVPACVVCGLLRGQGRGEIVTALGIPAVAGTPVLLVNPRVAVSTGPVFAAWDGVDRGAIDLEMPLGALRNDLEPAARGIAPVIALCLAALERSEATLVRMSGSGATCFALYDSVPACAAAGAQIAAEHPAWWVQETTLA